jgi:hypothetical protein
MLCLFFESHSGVPDGLVFLQIWIAPLLIPVMAYTLRLAHLSSALHIAAPACGVVLLMLLLCERYKASRDPRFMYAWKVLSHFHDPHMYYVIFAFYVTGGSS